MIIKEKIYRLFPFIPKINLRIGQKLFAMKVKAREPKIREQLAALNNIYANIGCGGAGLAEGWVNIDFSDYENVTHTYDCRKDLPFAPGTVKGIFCEHFFEHIDYNTEVPYFLAACYKALQPGGVVRIVVPDAEQYLIGYCKDGWDYLKKTRPLNDELVDAGMGIKYQTKMQLINEVFRQGGEHKYAWDFETMKLVMQEAGFTKIKKMAYKNSADPYLAIDQQIREPESLYVEAIR